jgi:universal stress protein A
VMRIANILVPTDFSENSQAAFERAYGLACQLGAKLYVLHIQDGSALRTSIKEELLCADSTDERLQASVQELIAERLSAMTAGLDRSELDIECQSRRGYPKTAIVNYAKEMHADIVVVGMRGITAMSTIASAALGSVAEYVLRRSPRPTLVVRLEHRRARA